jgi:hypothetical protein
VGTATLALVGLGSPASAAFAKTMRSWVLTRGSEGGYIHSLMLKLWDDMTKGVSLEQVREGLLAHPTFILVFPLLD